MLIRRPLSRFIVELSKFRTILVFQQSTDDYDAAFVPPRFKGDKETGPPQQRIRDDSAKAHIQELDSTKSTSRHESSPSSSVPRTSPPPMSSQAGAESQTAHVERKPELCVKLPLTELDWRISVSSVTDIEYCRCYRLLDFEYHEPRSDSMHRNQKVLTS